MKKFLAIYTGTPNGFEKWSTLSETERKTREKSGMVAWMAWGEKNAKQRKKESEVGGRMREKIKAIPFMTRGICRR